MIDKYREFIQNKQIQYIESGFSVEIEELNPNLFDFQKHLVKLAIAKGRFCLWLSTGLGKSICQLSWADQVAKHTNGRVLVLAPLVVAQQSEREGRKFGIECKYVRSPDTVNDRGIYITNYEILEKFDCIKFDGVVLDESGILKHFASKTKEYIVDRFIGCKYKLACSATPSPNDFMEIGNHAEFMEVMTRTEMLSMFFTHDGGDTGSWVLKGHAKKRFWEWVSGWAAMASHPKDLGFAHKGYDLPKMHQRSIVLDSQLDAEDGSLFRLNARSLSDQRRLQKDLFKEKCFAAAKLVNESDEQWIVWCHLNSESELLAKLIDDCVEVKGSDSVQHKEKAVLDFIDNKVKVIISKSSIMGFGVNLQNCRNAVFVGLSHSFESVFQSVRRIWRFGQTKEVNTWFVYHHLEGNIVANLNRKEEQFKDMGKYLIPLTKEAIAKFNEKSDRGIVDYIPTVEMIIPEWLKGE